MSSFIFIYLYLNFRERYLFIWLASSLLSLVRLALIDTPISSTDGYMILLYQGIFIFASFFVDDAVKQGGRIAAERKTGIHKSGRAAESV